MLLFNLAQGLKKNVTMTLKWANKFFALNIFGACNRGKCLLFLKLKIKRNCKKYVSFVQIKKIFCPSTDWAIYVFSFLSNNLQNSSTSEELQL